MFRIKLRTFDKKWRASLALGLFSLALLPAGLVSAATGAIAQPYPTTNTAITNGSLISFSSATPSDVTLASSGNVSALAGVAASQPLVELSSSGKDTVQVAIGGTINALVSNANGPVAIGDHITASPVSGIGMRATTAGQVVGTAQASLDSIQTATRTFIDTSGKEVQVEVGLLPIAVNVAYYSGSGSQGVLASFVPPFLQSIANSLTGKQVSPLRVLLGTAMLLFGLTTVIVMLYVAIKSGVISLGRNPLAQQALRRGLLDVIIAALGVLIVSGVIVYVILFS